jgi:hypothetical protein
MTKIMIKTNTLWHNPARQYYGQIITGILPDSDAQVGETINEIPAPHNSGQQN